MVTTASKLYFAAAAAALVAGWLYGLGTDGELVGVVFLGFKGAVGEHIGYTLLMVVALVLVGMGTASSILRDADPAAQAAVARLETLPPVVAPSGPSYWPVLGALGAVVAAIGLVSGSVLFVIGLLAVGLVMLEWMVSAWSERATGDPAINRRIRNRLMFPIEVPLGGALAILVMVVSVSRVFLALPEAGSWISAGLVAAVVLAVGFAVAYRPHLGRNVIAAVLALFAVIVIAGGIIGAAGGSRTFEHHGEGTSHESGQPSAGTSENGLGLPSRTIEGEG
jgi:hypothetical protein